MEAIEDLQLWDYKKIPQPKPEDYFTFYHLIIQHGAANNSFKIGLNFIALLVGGLQVEFVFVIIGVAHL